MNCWDRGLDKSLLGTATGTGLELGGFDGGATPAKETWPSWKSDTHIWNETRLEKGLSCDSSWTALVQ